MARTRKAKQEAAAAAAAGGDPQNASNGSYSNDSSANVSPVRDVRDREDKELDIDEVKEKEIANAQNGQDNQQIQTVDNVVSSNQKKNGLLNGHSGDKVVVEKTERVIENSAGAQQTLVSRTSQITTESTTTTSTTELVRTSTESARNNVKNLGEGGQLISIDNGPSSTDSGTGSDFNSNNVVNNQARLQEALIQDLLS